MKLYRCAITLMAAILAASCEMIPSRVSPIDASDLQEYSGQLFGHKLILPVEMAGFAVDFDRYLSMPDEDKPEECRFFGKVTLIPDRPYTYHVNDGRISCTVDTGGKSIWEDGASWHYYSFAATSYVNAYRTPKMYMSITDEMELVFSSSLPGAASEQLHVEIAGGENNASIIMQSYDGKGLYEWQMACFGEDFGSTGLRAEYSTGFGTGGMEISESFMENGTYKQFICNGPFIVGIFDGTTEVDWCRLIFNYGYAPTYQTSR